MFGAHSVFRLRPSCNLFLAHAYIAGDVRDVTVPVPDPGRAVCAGYHSGREPTGYSVLPQPTVAPPAVRQGMFLSSNVSVL